MTRFMITLEQSIDLVWNTIFSMYGGEIFVKKIPSMNIVDIANAIAPKAKINIVGMRPGEKIHEQLIGLEDAPYTVEYEDYYKILPNLHGWSNDKKRIGDGKKVKNDFVYNSLSNDSYMSKVDLQKWLKKNFNDINKR